jgi:multidrug transporter EmrE-like cation transporter
MRVIPILWSCLIGLASVLPIKFTHRGDFRGHLHDAVHILAFCVTIAIFSVCAKTMKVKAAYLIWTLFLAVLSEWSETVVFHSHFEWADVILDLAGVVLGLLLIAVATRPHGAAHLL